jgi:hypothetical protein
LIAAVEQGPIPVLAWGKPVLAVLPRSSWATMGETLLSSKAWLQTINLNQNKEFID